MKLVSGDPAMAVDQIPDGYSVRLIQPPRIIAKITGKFTLGASTFYTWEEVRPLLNGSGYETAPGGQTGTNSTAYAAELNGLASVPNDAIVILWPRVIADTSALSASGEVVALMEFQYAGGGAGGAVSSVQCIGNTLYVTYGA